MTYEDALSTARFIQSEYKAIHKKEGIKVALVLGSGLGAFAEEVENRVVLPYDMLPNFARSTVEGHAGNLVLGTIADVPVIIQQGRFHYYEGYDLQEVTFPIRVFGLLGIKNLILTNAAGSIDSNFKPGSLMLIHDHLNLMGVNPLRGKNDERFGARFPDMSEVYSRKFQEIAKTAAKEMNFDLRRGVYCALSGPTYETPAEIHYLRYAGADAVGMSTVPEAIIAHHQGMKILAISCVSNYAAGISEEEINHEEVMEIGKLVAETFKNLLKRVIPKIAEEK